MFTDDFRVEYFHGEPYIDKTSTRQEKLKIPRQPKPDDLKERLKKYRKKVEKGEPLDE